jgi:hypothetical protein
MFQALWLDLCVCFVRQEELFTGTPGHFLCEFRCPNKSVQFGTLETQRILRGSWNNGKRCTDSSQKVIFPPLSQEFKHSPGDHFLVETEGCSDWQDI